MGITALLAEHITALIGQTGYISVFVFMIMESMVFPIPSEAVMPFAGFLIATKTFSFAGVIAISTLGSIIGSLISYYIGVWGGKPFISRYGKYLLINEKDMAWTEEFFKKHGQLTIFICRFIPVVRHLISIPAGIARMNITLFCIYTIIGAGLWNSFLTVVGFYLRQNWATVMRYSHVVDIVVVVGLMAGVVFFVYKHLVKNKK